MVELAGGAAGGGWAVVGDGASTCGACRRWWSAAVERWGGQVAGAEWWLGEALHGGRLRDANGARLAGAWSCKGRWGPEGPLTGAKSFKGRWGLEGPPMGAAEFQGPVGDGGVIEVRLTGLTGLSVRYPAGRAGGGREPAGGWAGGDLELQGLVGAGGAAGGGREFQGLVGARGATDEGRRVSRASGAAGGGCRGRTDRSDRPISLVPCGT
ncbi:uncharacterized protein LOC131061356 [Cryptomeria japonica]|uniref:uncharacterized protein LOC131061356 n=1 Tax=Cryptomeria japonica TaxID=3369 RepID=UPI0025AB7EBE|nr:uncharacterized protein LOC131061356 [Cryptomeria japonica]